MWNALQKKLENPGASCRSKPFWAWNGRLEPEELRRQIRVMRGMGMGGFFMHARVGLDTPYLGREWFEAVDACVDEARIQKMEAWIYDEDRFPSGAAGGLVTQNKAFRKRGLEVRDVDKPATFRWTPDVRAVFAVRDVDAHTVADPRLCVRGKPLPRKRPGERLVEFRVVVDPGDPTFNGQTYLDVMNPAAVRAFIRVTHEAYLKRYGKDFGDGNVVPGIFTDEPNYGHYLAKPAANDPGAIGRLPWTDGLPAAFRKAGGGDIAEALPEIVWDVEGRDCAPARWRFLEAATQLFTQAFSRQIGEWCGRHNLQFTGHYYEENSLSEQIHLNGAVMRHYEYMQAPGMDNLTEYWRIYEAAKSVASAARQFGRAWRLTETYGC
ncbi:MAG: hypothetical protein FWF96_05830, partial [Kiritimatiellaeota bacterium]|nr:hypothetical protein [Kiritimatiellota bacterium]